MVPPFDLQGGVALAAARGATVSSLLSAFGATLFHVAIAPPTFRKMGPSLAAASEAKLRLIVQAATVGAIVSLGVWLVLQTGEMADVDTLSATFGAAPVVLWKTSFGHIVLLQYVALGVLSAVTFRPRRGRPYPALAASCIALALQAGHSHAFSMQPGPSLLLGCDVLHLLGAGAWLGGLPPLLLVVWTAPSIAAATAARWFSPIGQAAIAAILVSALVQGWILVGSVPGLIGTAYGWLVLVKLALFGVLCGFGWWNRHRFAPALLRGDPDRARLVLTRSILLQTVAAIAVITAAIVLSGLPPAMHLQPLWPFSARLSLDAVREDPDFLREVIAASCALAAALAGFLLTLALRRLRLAAGAVALVVGWFAVPHFNLLLVTAYPTSFYRSPTGFAASSIAQGAEIFATRCTECHGRDGGGNGKQAGSLPVPPADLTASHLWMHRDGELFWWIGEGMATPEGVPAMPGFAPTLDEDARWAVIDYIRALNAGTARRRSGEWPHIVKAPDFGLPCAGGTRLSDLRGRFVRLIIGPHAVQPGALPRPAGDIVTVQASVPSAARPEEACETQDEAVAPAYAVIAGLDVAAMPGMQFIVDPAGWLRAMQPSRSSGGWDDPVTLLAEIRSLQDHQTVPVMTGMAPMKMPM